MLASNHDVSGVHEIDGDGEDEPWQQPPGVELSLNAASALHGLLLVAVAIVSQSAAPVQLYGANTPCK